MKIVSNLVVESRRKAVSREGVMWKSLESRDFIRFERDRSATRAVVAGRRIYK